MEFVEFQKKEKNIFSHCTYLLFSPRFGGLSSQVFFFPADIFLFYLFHFLLDSLDWISDSKEFTSFVEKNRKGEYRFCYYFNELFIGIILEIAWTSFSSFW